MIIDNQNINDINSLNYQSVGPYSGSIVNQVLDIIPISAVMNYRLGYTYYNADESAQGFTPEGDLEDQNLNWATLFPWIENDVDVAFALTTDSSGPLNPDESEVDNVGPYDLLDYESMFPFGPGQEFIVESVEEFDDDGILLNTIYPPSDIFVFYPPGHSKWLGYDIENPYSFEFYMTVNNHHEEWTDILPSGNDIFREGNRVNIVAVKVFREHIGSVYEPWQGRDIINNVEHDNRFSLGTYTETNRGFWEMNTYDFSANKSQLNDEKIITTNTTIVNQNLYSDIFGGDGDFVNTTTSSFSIDAFPFTIKDDKSYPLFFYYDRNLHKEEYGATTDGKVHLKISRRELGRPDGINFNPFLDRPLIDDIFPYESVGDSPSDEEEGEAGEAPIYILSLNVDGHESPQMANPQGTIRLGTENQGVYVPREVNYESGSNVVLYAEPLHEDAVFDGWSGDVVNGNDNPTISINMDGNKTITAKFVWDTDIPTLENNHQPIDLDNMWFGEEGDTTPTVSNSLQSVDVQDLTQAWNFNVRFLHEEGVSPKPFTSTWNWSVHGVWYDVVHNEWRTVMLGYQEYVDGVNDDLQLGAHTLTGGDTSQTSDGNVYELSYWSWGLNQIRNQTQPTDVYYYIEANDSATGQSIRSTLGEIHNLFGSNYGSDDTGDDTETDDTETDDIQFPSDEYDGTPTAWEIWTDSNGNNWLFTQLTNQQAGISGNPDSLTFPPVFGWILYNLPG